MLTRVRWNNVVLAVVVLGVVGLVAGWPLLGSPDVELPPPVGVVEHVAATPSPRPSATPRPRKRMPRVAPPGGRKGGLGGQLSGREVGEAARVRPAVTAAPTVTVAPTVVAIAPPPPAAPVAPAAPAPRREFDGFER